MVKYRASFFLFYFMQNKQDPQEPQDEQPTLEDLRRELSIYDDEPSDDLGGWDLGKEELL